MQLAYKWQAASVVAIGLFMAVLDTTIVSVALPRMAQVFHTSFQTITWVATAYFLAQAAVIPITGYLSDRIGSKIAYVTSLLLFVVGSALCAFAPSDSWLIGFRVIQGIGGGALFPLAFAITFRIFPPQERGPASAIVGVPVLLAPAFGPTIGGYLTTTFDWNAIFLLNVPIGIVALVLALLVLHSHEQETEQAGTAPGTGRFDLLGLILAMAGFTALVYGITEAGPNGWRDVTVDRYLGAGVLILIAFVLVELRAADPVLDVRLFLQYSFAMANVVMWVIGAFLFGSLFLLPYFFEDIQGLSPLSSGEILIGQGLAAGVGVAMAGRLYNRVGPRVLATLGMVLATLAMIGFTHLTVTTTGRSLQGWLILRGLGLGLTNVPMQTLALAVVSNRAMARASSLVNVTRQVFSAIGVSALTSYLAQQAKTHGADLAATLRIQPPSGVGAACLQSAGHNRMALAQCLQQHAQVLGLNDTFMLVLLGCAACVVVALLVGRDPALEATKNGENAVPTGLERSSFPEI
jgi:EmrB/QacA subfamily drug resistance transporter